MQVKIKDLNAKIAWHPKSFKKHSIANPIKLENLKKIILLIDATYWCRNFGVALFKDAILAKFICWNFIKGKELFKLSSSDFKCKLKEWRKKA